MIGVSSKGIAVARSRLRRALDIVFAGAQTLDPRITFTRASTATRFNASGVLTSEAINAARFDYDPVTLAPKGLLIEEQRTNLVTYSEQFDNAAWAKTRSSITANAIVSPDGTADADKLVEDTTASNTHLLTQGISFTSGTAYTCSIFAKQAEAGRFLQVTLPAAAFGTTLRGAFDLTNGTFALTASTTGSITPVGNGWYKCSITGTATATISATLGVFIANSSAVSAAAVTYTGDGTSGIYIWGAQLEAGAFATSYIPTVASQVTRAADLALMTGTNFSSWYNATEGTLFAQADWLGLSNNDYFFAINNGSSNNLIALGVSSTPATRFIITDGGVTQASVSGPTPVANTAFKIAGAYQVNNFAAATNGVLGTVDTSGTVPTVMSEVSLTSSYGSVNLFNGHIQRIAYYNRRLTNAELQGITS